MHDDSVVPERGGGAGSIALYDRQAIRASGLSGRSDLAAFFLEDLFLPAGNHTTTSSAG